MSNDFVCCENGGELPHGVYLGRTHLAGDFVARCASCDFVSAYWDCFCELSHACEIEEECPNHGGAYDCPPFCELCAGDQMVPVLVKKG